MRIKISSFNTPTKFRGRLAKNENKTKYQYSDLEALPEKLKKFLYADCTDSIKFI